MRIATRNGLLSWTYVLRNSRKSPALATVDMKSLKTEGTITVDSVVYGFEQTDLFGKQIVLTFEGIELAKATRTSVWTQKTQVTLASGGLPGSDLRLIPLGAFQVGYKVNDDEGARIGRIERKGFFTATFLLHLPETMPLPLQGFLMALAMADLRRRQSS